MTTAVREVDMDLRQIESLVAVADERHFGRTADRLFVSTSVVSQHVSQLERELGVRLFERSTRNVRIEAVQKGKVMFGVAQAASDGLDSFVLAHEPLGCLAVHRDNPLSLRDSVSVADLTGQRYMVSQEREYADLHGEIVSFFADVGVSPVFTSFPARREQDVLDLVGAGLGICLLRTSLVSRTGGGTVVRRRVEGTVPMFHYVLVWRSDEMSLLARSFVEHARVSLAKLIEEVCPRAVRSITASCRCRLSSARDLTSTQIRIDGLGAIISISGRQCFTLPHNSAETQCPSERPMRSRMISLVPP